MKTVALLTARNEELYLPYCLEHLYKQGIQTCYIDNGSADKSLEIAEKFVGRGVIRIEKLPYKGCFKLYEILEFEEKLSRDIKADWFMHHDADEIRIAPKKYKTLIEGISDADNKGFNAINFNEFIFLPTSDRDSYEGQNFAEKMQYYFFYKTKKKFNRLNTWKNTNNKIDLKKNGGHFILTKNLKIFPTPFNLMHYIALSKKHLTEKYVNRKFCQDEVENLNWHKSRIEITPENIFLPEKSILKKKTANNNFDETDPKESLIFIKK